MNEVQFMPAKRAFLSPHPTSSGAPLSKRGALRPRSGSACLRGHFAFASTAGARRQPCGFPLCFFFSLFIKVFEESRGTFFKKSLWWGMGRSPNRSPFSLRHRVGDHDLRLHLGGLTADRPGEKREREQQKRRFFQTLFVVHLHSSSFRFGDHLPFSVMVGTPF